MAGMFESVFKARWGKDDQKMQSIREAFPDVNEEAICRALLNYQGNFPPYPKDIETMVYQYDIEGMFQKGIRRLNGITKEEQLAKIRRGIMEDMENERIRTRRTGSHIRS